MPLDRAEIIKRKIAALGPEWLWLPDAVKLLNVSAHTLYGTNYRSIFATKQAGIAGRGGGVAVRRADVIAVNAIRAAAHVEFRTALRIFAARAELLPVLAAAAAEAPR
jgi:hypothetical protein